MSSEFKLAFITSAGHSGSTLLDMLIGSQPGAVSTGELVLLPQEAMLNGRCTCRQQILQCPFWVEVLTMHLRCSRSDLATAVKALNLGWMPVARPQRGINDGSYQYWRALSHGIRYAELKLGFGRGVLSGRTYRNGLQSTLEIYGAVARASGASLLVNSSKHYLHAIDNFRTLGGKARVIILVRDGRAVFASFLRHGQSREFAIKAWKKHYERAMPLLEQWVPSHSRKVVRYEDLAREPVETMRDLMDFLGTEFDPAQVRLGARVHHNVNGNDMRFSKAVDIKLDERWRRELSKQDLDFFERGAGEMNRRFGYVSV